MKIEVTQEDIDNGKSGQSDCCPIALACQRLGMDSPQVDSSIVTDDGLEYSLTTEAEDFIQKFDNDQKVEPFSFEAEPVERDDDGDEVYDD